MENVDDPLEPTEEVRQEKSEGVVRFIGVYVSRLYGDKAIKVWMKKNKGKTFLDMITMSDVAYCVALIENSHEVWEEELEVKKEIAKLMPDEQEKFRKKGKLSKKEKKTFLKREPKDPRFTSRKGTTRAYLSNGWNRDGVRLFNQIWATFKGVASNRDTWEKMKILWEEYVEKSGFGKEWKMQTMSSEDGNAWDEEEEEELPSDRFALPGDEEFRKDCEYGNNDSNVSPKEKVDEEEALNSKYDPEEDESVEDEDERSESDSHNDSSLPLLGLGKRLKGSSSPERNNKCARILSPYTG